MPAQVLMPERSLAPPLPAGADGLSRAMDDVLSAESEFVAKFLPLQGMTRVPAGFAEFAQWHFDSQPPGLAWRNAAPAYALACLSHAAYGGALDPSVEWELELQWADLATLSSLSWAEARPLVMAAWSYLSGGEALPAGLDALDAEDEAPVLAAPRLDLELAPAFVVLRESMARRAPAEWLTRGQERWLPTDVPALLFAASPALAVLDAVVLHGFAEEEPRLLVRLAYAPNLLRVLDGPAGDNSPLGLARQRRDAMQWIEQGESLLLQVPSPGCPGEFNLLANPRHPDFARLQRFDSRPLLLDRRRRSH